MKRKVFKELPAAVEPTGFKKARVFVVVTPSGEWYAQGSSWEQSADAPGLDFFGRMLSSQPQHFGMADIYIPIPPKPTPSRARVKARRRTRG